LKITGVVNHSLLYWGDGGKRKAYIVGSAQDGSTLSFESEAKLGPGWKVGSKFSLDLLSAPSDTADQIDPSASSLSGGARRGIQSESRPSGIDLGEATVKIEQDRLGAAYQ
jgi:hypothetical protein